MADEREKNSPDHPADPAPDVAGHIAALMIYPVKSCAGIHVRQARLLPTGLEWDRCWMVVDSEGLFVSQREFPSMALVQPRMEPSGCSLSAPGMAQLELPATVSGNKCRVQVWDDVVWARDCGDAPARWFADYLNLPGCRLVRFDPESLRLSSPKWTKEVSAPNQFSDGYPLLVATDSALTGLNTRLAAAGHTAVGIERFRPNIVLGGLPDHEEDFLDTLQLDNGISLRLVKPCARCPIPDIDPATGRSHPAVSDALQAYRPDARLNGAITFGMNAIVLTGGGSEIRVGDRVSGGYLF